LSYLLPENVGKEEEKKKEKKEEAKPESYEEAIQEAVKASEGNIITFLSYVSY
jgi:hypothetical protein